MDVSTTIQAPAETVWGILTDTSLWPTWGPSVRAVRCQDRFIGPASRGEVLTPLGSWLPFRVTNFEQGVSWSWNVAGVGATGHRVEKLTEQSCRLVFEIPLWAAPYAAICKLAAARIARLAGA